MSDINFLSNGRSKDKKEKPGEEVSLEWKEPEKENKSKGNDGKSKHAIGIEKKRGFFEKVRIKEFRKEVLSEIKKENGTSGGKAPVGYFFSWLKRVKEKIAGLFKKNETTDKKGLIMNNQEVFDMEKEKRSNGKKTDNTERADLFRKEKILFGKKGDNEGISSEAKEIESENIPEAYVKKPNKIFGEKLKFSAPGWESLKVIKTNLIEGEESAFFDWNKKIIFFAINILSACLLVGIIYFGLVFWEKSFDKREKIIISEIEKAKENIAKLEENIGEIDEFQKKLNQSAGILSRHIYWTNFFKFLEENTLEDVYYTGGFSSKTGSEYSLKAVGNDYSDIEGQLKVLRSADEVLSAESYSASKAEDKDGGGSGGSVSFDIDLKIKPRDVFLK